MTRRVEFEVDGAPVGKSRPRVTRNGSYTPKRTREYEKAVRCAASDAMHGHAPFQEAVAVQVSAVVPIPKSWTKKRRHDALDGDIQPKTKPDVDNYAKAAVDACNGVIFRDDSQIAELTCRKMYGDQPRLVVTVTPMEAAPC